MPIAASQTLTALPLYLFTPPMPSDIKREAELRKREELEKLDEADTNARKSGLTFTPGAKIDPNAPATDGTANDNGKPLMPVSKPVDIPPLDKPPVIKPPVTQSTPHVAPTVEKPAGTKPKGKKGDG